MAGMPNPTILALMAHPDDAEFLCAGALFLLADLGCEIHVAAMAPGDCGSPDKPAAEIATIRREEGRRAAALYPGEYRQLFLFFKMINEPIEISLSFNFLFVIGQ